VQDIRISASLSEYFRKKGRLEFQEGPSGGVFIEVPGVSQSLVQPQRVFGLDENQASLVELGKQLLAAARDGDTEGVRGLMARGAPFTADWLGTSPLHLTAQHGNFTTCEVLLRAGCSRDARTKVDKTPLHVAAQEGHADICELLLMSGAEVDARDILLMTPLHWAVERGNVHSMEVLLKHGASVEAESKFDKSPSDIADDNGRPDLKDVISNGDNYRLGLSNNDGLVDPQSFQSLCQDVGMPVTTQEEIQCYNVKEGMTLEMDPVQLALSSAGEIVDTSTNILQDQTQDLINSLPDLDGGANGGTSNDEAIRLLEAHGIRMLPEEELNISQSLTLTEAGKLVLSSLNPPNSLPTLNPPISSFSSPFTSLPTPLSSTRTVSLASPRPIRLGSPRSVTLSSPRTTAGEVKVVTSLTSRITNSPLNTIRSIDLPNTKLGRVTTIRPSNINTITSSRPGFLNKNTVSKVVTLSSTPTKLNPKVMSTPTITTSNKQPRVIKLTPQQFAALKSGKSGKIVLAGTGNNSIKRESITLANQQIRKAPRSVEISELKRKLESEMKEADRLRQEARQRDDSADKIRKQIEMLSNI